MAVSSSRRWSPATKIAQQQLRLAWRQAIADGLPPALKDTGFRIFSQFEEDGLLLYVFTLIGERTRTFVDIGAADGIGSNCANLAINHQWDGLFLDGNAEAVRRGEEFYRAHPDTEHWPPRFVNALLTRDNVNELISSAGFSGEIDLLSIDIDGNDYWIWDALEVVTPRVVLVEANIELGTRNLVAPYRPDYVRTDPDDWYFGASLVAFNELASQRGYRLVGSIAYGFNAIFVRADEGPELGQVAPEQLLRHRRSVERAARFGPLRDRPFVRGGTGYPGEVATTDDLW